MTRLNQIWRRREKKKVVTLKNRYEEEIQSTVLDSILALLTWRSTQATAGSPDAVRGGGDHPED